MPDTKGQNGVLFFTTMPNLRDLCCLTISIPASEKNKDNVNAFQPQVIKCREFIFTEPDVLASPVLGASKKIQIIMQVDLYHNGRLQARLQRMNIQSGEPKPVTAAEFQSCLQYTLNARLAPLWNKMGSSLVQGREFVTSIQKMNAVSLNVTVNKSELYLRVSAAVVKSPPVGLSDLDVCGPVVDSFLDGQASSSTSMIEEYSIGNKWCYILPSMKRGQIVNILRDIPSDSPFNCYKSMKKYWKNMYGYRLPESEEGLLYYQVYFKPIGNSLFTYPECCVRLKQLTLFNCPDTNVVLQQFLADFQTKMPTICGEKVVIQSKAMSTIPRLNMSSTQVETSGMANLSETDSSNMRSHYKREGPHKSGHLFTPWKPISSQVNSDRNSALCSQKRASLPLQKEIKDSKVLANNGKTNGSDASHYFNENSTVDQHIHSSATESLKADKIIPMFASKYTKKNVISGRVKPFTNEPRTVPMFGKLSKQPVYNISQNSYAETNIAPPSGQHMAERTTTFDRSIPNFGTQVQSNPSLSADYNRQNNLNFRPSVPNIPRMPVIPVHKKINGHTNSSVRRSQPVSTTPVIQKRKAEILNETPKKARVKPKVQEGVDVRQMAQTNQLDKLNTQTLMMWLKSKGVPYKSKDKKGVLIEKVLAAIQIASAEQ